MRGTLGEPTATLTEPPGRGALGDSISTIEEQAPDRGELGPAAATALPAPTLARGWIPEPTPMVSPPSGLVDPRSAIAAFLMAEIGASVSNRVWRPEVPKERDAEMPTGAIVVGPAGGGMMFGRDRLPVFDSIIDVTCFGKTRLQAENIGDEAQASLREMEPQTREGIRMYWARIAGAVKSAIDPQTNWPFSLITIQVMHSLASEVIS